MGAEDAGEDQEVSQEWLPLFREFQEQIKIDSKETGVGPLVPYDSQLMFLHEICKGLDNDKHHFTCLKARQLGISTVSLALDLFWLYVHPGLQGALVTDTEDNRDKFRVILSRYILSLPPRWRIGTKAHNRNSLVLTNGSVLDYVVAGTKRGKGGLGRSRAWNFVHATECSSYGDQDGLDSMAASLAQRNPDRLYIFESTARGLNVFFDMWERAGEDDTQHRFFIGWWAKEDYSISHKDKRFARYTEDDLTDYEREQTDLVEKEYGHTISMSQLAWYRWYRETHMSSDGMMAQEFPWTAEEAFVVTGKTFFPSKMVVAERKRARTVKFQGYRYHVGEDFRATEVEQVTRSLDADLRIYEEPSPHGIYVIGADPAFGQNEYKDAHTVEVLRCYADRTIQVAELATPDCATYQFAWMLCHLAGAYRNCMINLEITGPGALLMREMRNLRQLIQEGKLSIEGESRDWLEIFSNVRWYLFNKPDSMGAGYMYNWKMNSENKQQIMNGLRDEFQMKHIRIQSVPLLLEMEKIVQDGSQIQASGRNKDDRVIAMALANEAYLKWRRPSLITEDLTYEKVCKMELEEHSTTSMYSHIVENFFKARERERVEKDWGY